MPDIRRGWLTFECILNLSKHQQFYELESDQIQALMDRPTQPLSRNKRKPQRQNVQSKPALKQRRDKMRKKTSRPKAAHSVPQTEARFLYLNFAEFTCILQHTHTHTTSSTSCLLSSLPLFSE